MESLLLNGLLFLMMFKMMNLMVSLMKMMKSYLWLELLFKLMLNLKNLFNNQKQLNRCGRKPLNLKLKNNSQKVYSKLLLNQRRLWLCPIINLQQELLIQLKLDQEVHLLHHLEFLSKLIKKERQQQMLLPKS